MASLQKMASCLGLALAIPLASSGGLQAGEPDHRRTEKLAELVTKLDSADFLAREMAVRQLREMVADDTDGLATGELQERALDAKLSFEAQSQLAELLGESPQKEPASPPASISQAEIEQLIDDLEHDQFRHREAAARRLDWLLKADDNVVPILLAIKQRLKRPELSNTQRQGLIPHHAAARKAWLLAPEGKCQLPPVADEQIVAAIATISNSATDEVGFSRQQEAQRELEDLLCRDEYRERISLLLRQALESAQDIPAKARLNDLMDLTRPAMVAEIWSSTRFVTLGGGVVMTDAEPFKVRQATTQYLHIGVPQIPEGSNKATHFDYCDDVKAHCVSGNTLLPGDYPVGTAIAHPAGDSVIFHLINLPTPRRRLIYEISSERSEAVRLRELSQRTCNALIAKERTLTAPDVPVLMLLDHAVVSNFAGDYFTKVEDATLTRADGRLIVGQTSTHGGVCYALAFTGTKEAAPGLIKALADKRISPPDAGAYYDLPRIALLNIARKDPWESVNDWLGEQLSSERALVTNLDPAPDLAATAAALLADRVGESPAKLGLVPMQEGFCMQLGLPIYRFADDAAKTRAIEWWQGKSAELARSKGS